MIFTEDRNFHDGEYVLSQGTFPLKAEIWNAGRGTKADKEKAT